ncbi:MAG: NADH-quinone oxidoreductase subunit G [Rhodospirillales bacterium]|nr:NADH-quinone oxidoreductase subunit G [Rhodospirillales bacterium]
MPKLTIDGQSVEVPAGFTVIQACEVAGIEIPRFCYHERLSIAGNCRMCLVAMERSPKPIASCAQPVADGMVIHTNTEMVRKARRGVMEFLLLNHPLDCPICDQGGECDLQDQAMAYGYHGSRYQEPKRAVKEQDFGPLISTAMTRCIHCTRCIRFATEVAGVQELGATGRGEDMEVGTYVQKALSSELSGNMIDLCPVGALTNRPYAFEARSWELAKIESIDVMDAIGSNIRVDVRGPEVLRVLPRVNEDVNEEWISDKTRFACDGLMRQRLDRPYVRRNGKLQAATWDEAFAAIAERLKGVPGSRIAALAGDLACAESMYAVKELMAALGSTHLDCRQDGAPLDAENRAGYLFNTTIAGVEKADVCLLIGTDPRREAPILNARLRKRYLMGGFDIGLVGAATDLTYDYRPLGSGQGALDKILSGDDPFAKKLAGAKHPMLIVGMGALARPDGAAVLAQVGLLAERYHMVGRTDGWNGFNVLHTAASRVGGLTLGFVPGRGGKDTNGILEAASAGALDAVYLLGADEIDMGRLGHTFVIYQGHHGDAGAHRADVILPGAAYTEKSGTYVNTEGLVQRTTMAVFAPGEAREDWAIVRALSAALGRTLPFDDLATLRQRMVAAYPRLETLDHITPSTWRKVGVDGQTSDQPFVSPVENFYMTDPISRASPTMAACVDTFGAGTAKTGTHG